MALSGNKGEWSEIYALFKLLGDKELYSGDADLNKVEDLFYPIIKIIRTETGGDSEFELKGDLVFLSGTVEASRIPVKKFKEFALLIFNKIKSERSVFRIPEVEQFLNEINCHTLKAKSTKKTDIVIVIHDARINQNAELGFSIKSQLGNDSTLLNAGKTTNFIFQIQGGRITPIEISGVNNIDTKSKIKDRLIKIKELGGDLIFLKPEKDVFKNNLVLIDSLLPNIIAEIVKTFFTTILSSVKDLTKEINTRNPLNYDKQFAHSFYEYKIKRFLTDVALGMMPSVVWGGVYDATGGYLIVKEDGEVLCYHIYNRNQFEDYLFNNTKLETASSTRHEFGKVYKDGAHLYFKLNLQIRFL